jgi:Na+-translocating ferredoxin:NAD+ oxidoreductase RnfE subunit
VEVLKMHLNNIIFTLVTEQIMIFDTKNEATTPKLNKITPLYFSYMANLLQTISIKTNKAMLENSKMACTFYLATINVLMIENTVIAMIRKANARTVTVPSC